MKLSVIGPTYPFRGGISHYTSLLVRTLRSHDDVQFISYRRQYPAWLYPGNNDRDPSTSLLVHELPNVEFDALNPWAWWRIVHRIREHGSRFVILPWSVFYWTPYYFIFLKALKGVTQAAALFICHNVVEHESSWLKSWVSKRVLRMGDMFITHSQWDKVNLQRWIGDLRSNQIWVSPHPVYQHLRGQPLTKADAREGLGLQKERVLLFFGFIREYKGLRYLLESLPYILKRYSVHLIIAGEVWENKKVYSNLIRKLSLQDKVTFVHHYIPNEKVESFFAAADLVVIPYTTATQSGIVQLAFGFRKPVVVGKVGGLVEVVEDQKNGYLVPPRDPKAIADAVLDFYDKNRESEMTQNITSGLSRFSWQGMVETIHRVIVQRCHGDSCENAISGMD